MITFGGYLPLAGGSLFGKLTVVSALGAQLRLAYDAANYADFAVNNVGVLNIDGVGGGIGRASAGGFLEWYILNNDNTNANSRAVISAYVGGPNGGDAYSLWQILSGGLTWSAGIDNSDSDRFKISKGAPGTNTYLQVDENGEVTVNAAAALYPVAKTLNVNVAAVGNVGAGTDDLITFAVPANILSANGKTIRIKAWGSTANNAAAKTLTFVVGSQTVVSTLLTASIAGMWEIEVLIVRTGSNTQDIVARCLQGATLIFDQELTAGTQTDSAQITVKCTGNATSNNDIVQEGMVTEVIN